MTTALELWDKLRQIKSQWIPSEQVFSFVVTPNERETILNALRAPRPEALPRDPTGAMLGLIAGEDQDPPLMTRARALTVYRAVLALARQAEPRDVDAAAKAWIQRVQVLPVLPPNAEEAFKAGASWVRSPRGEPPNG